MEAPPACGNEGNHRELKRVGYCVSAKKRKKFLEPFAEFLEEQGVECVEVDVFGTEVPTVKVELLIHKIVDELAAAQEDEACMKSVGNLEKYIAANPEMVVVEDLQSVVSVMDRKGMCDKLRECGLTVPPYLVWESGNEIPDFGDSGCEYPLICKTIGSCGSKMSHRMGVAEDEKALKALMGTLERPLLLQNYLDHSDVVWKAYVANEKLWTLPRGSIHKHRASGAIFDSQELKAPPDSSGSEAVAEQGPPTREELQAICQKVKEGLNLNLMGVDIIQQEGTRNLFVIDINYLPGYSGVSDIFDVLFDYIKRRFCQDCMSAPSEPPQEGLQMGA